MRALCGNGGTTDTADSDQPNHDPWRFIGDNRREWPMREVVGCAMGARLCLLSRNLILSYCPLEVPVSICITVFFGCCMLTARMWKSAWILVMALASSKSYKSAL